MARLPLTPPRQHSAAVMLNLLGDLWFARGAAASAPDWAAVLALPGTHLHLYGKAEAKTGPQDGPPERHRAHRGSRTRHGAAGRRAAGHRRVLRPPP